MPGREFGKRLLEYVHNARRDREIAATKSNAPVASLRVGWTAQVAVPTGLWSTDDLRVNFSQKIAHFCATED